MNDELWISGLGLRTRDYELGIIGLRSIRSK
jgi:hypothetical protein